MERAIFLLFSRWYFAVFQINYFAVFQINGVKYQLGVTSGQRMLTSLPVCSAARDEPRAGCEVGFREKDSIFRVEGRRDVEW